MNVRKTENGFVIDLDESERFMLDVWQQGSLERVDGVRVRDNFSPYTVQVLVSMFGETSAIEVELTRLPRPVVNTVLKTITVLGQVNPLML